MTDDERAARDRIRAELDLICEDFNDRAYPVEIDNPGIGTGTHFSVWTPEPSEKGRLIYGRYSTFQKAALMAATWNRIHAYPRRQGQ